MNDLVRHADALWRAITYLSVAQLHLKANPMLSESLTTAHVKEHPAGHWGTVPGTAFALTHIALAGTDLEGELVPVIGAGHAGVVQASMAWLTGDLARVRPRFSPDADGLSRLVTSFPDLGGLGSEVSPCLPGGWYLGGQIGGALAFAQGAALDAANRIVLPVLGDGECETPTTAAAWLAARALPGHAGVLPIVHVNGFRMGDRSLLGTLDDDALRAYATGLGFTPDVVHVRTADAGEHQAFHDALSTAITATDNGQRRVIFLRCAKGWGGPAYLAGQAILGTSRAHKTPITEPARDLEQFAVLRQWLASYRPAELFDPDGTATAALADAIRLVRGHGPQPAAPTRSTPGRLIPARYDSFAEAVTAVVRRHARIGDFRLFSPDELASNRLGHLADEPWTAEVLAEEVLLGWLAGWTASGRRGLLVSYEAFAPLLLTGLIQLLKQRRLTSTDLPSVNVLLTSYGWHNSYTHGDPSLTTALLATHDPAVRVLTPADPSRLAATLDHALDSTGKVNVIVAGKHATTPHPRHTITQELETGLAVWPHASDDGEPDLILAAAGDLPAAVTCAAAQAIRDRDHLRVRVVGVQDLTVFGDPTVWPAGLSDAQLEQYFGTTTPLLITTLGHPAAVWGLLENRLHRPIEVIGWPEPDGPMAAHQLATEAGMDVAGLCAAAKRLQAVRHGMRPTASRALAKRLRP
jgi:xylulose-5-phosphate/fructose-6-phosphate phosphoketolase